MRPLNLVIEAIRNVVRTEEFEGKTEFLTELRKIEPKCNVEQLNANSQLWVELSGVLNKYLEKQDSPWKELVAEIYQGKADFTKYL